MITKKSVALAAKNGTLDQLYHSEIERLVEVKYSLRQEVAVQRQREAKPEEFAAYNAYVEACKERVKAQIRAFGGDV